MVQQRPFIAGNWKMNMLRGEARELASRLREAVPPKPPRLMVLPPFTALDIVAEVLAGSPIEVGAQGLSNAKSGAFTGEVSAAMLQDVGAVAVLVGHSERRHVLGEDDELIRRKLERALQSGLEVILCVGETLPQRESGAQEQIVAAQLLAALEGIGVGELAKVTVAYEPVWAIGTGKTASAADAAAMHVAIRAMLADRFDRATATAVPIQYGGSVKPDNAPELLAQENVDGLLVGGAALAADTFASIAQCGADKGA